jgi:hypothetical protein
MGAAVNVNSHAVTHFRNDNLGSVVWVAEGSLACKLLFSLLVLLTEVTAYLMPKPLNWKQQII